MGTLPGERTGVWVLFQGERYWLSYISEDYFKKLKERGIDHLEFRIEKGGQSLPAQLSQLELAE